MYVPRYPTPVRRRPRETKSIFDPVHGVVDVGGVALDLIGVPAFQRLWGIRQTGFAHLVFPGANHTRLEHSLGAYWVAGALADRLGLPDADRDLVTSAALLHDLGHAPFSHTLEPTMVEVLGHGHEAVSRRRILGTDDDARDGPSVAETLARWGVSSRRVAELVDPPARRGPATILAAMLHGAIDVDRIDYLQRDAHYTGVAHGAIDAVRLLATARNVGGRLAFAEKGRSAVEGFLVGRSLMYTSVYYHKTVRAAEMMAQAAVEGIGGYPETARPLFGLTDGALLAELRRAGGLPARLARALEDRALFKRAHGWREVDPGDRRALERLRGDPSRRRAWEGAVARRVRAGPGEVLLDLAGLASRDRDGADWGEVALVEHAKLTYPFRGDPAWRAFTARAPAPWAVSVYTAPPFRAAVRRLFARHGPLDI